MQFYSEEKKAIRELLKLGLGFHYVDVGMKHQVHIGIDDVCFADGSEDIFMSTEEENECYELLISFYNKHKSEQVEIKLRENDN